MGDRQVRAALLESPDGQIVEAPPQTWVPSVLVPLVQNVIGGLAVAALVGVVWRWIAGSLPPDWWVPALSAGAVWATIWTIVRFFADDLGLLRAAYAAGAASRDAQVNALMLEVQSLRTVIEVREGGATGSNADIRIADMNATLKGARELIPIFYSGDKISRASMAQRGMGQARWEKVITLCKAAGVFDDQGKRRIRDVSDALKAVEQLHSTSVVTVKGSKRGGVPWG